METQILRADLGTQLAKEEGEVGRYGESNRETYITICEIDSQWEFAIYDAGNSTQGSITT